MLVGSKEDRQIGQIIGRLLAGFPLVPQDNIVGSVRDRFDGAPIRDFIPLFVERHSKDELTARSAITAARPR
jgi:hypothetical protein